ncbi:MAG: Fur family transcriptional regulator, partial [Promethearchaeota archaeon]
IFEGVKKQYTSHSNLSLATVYKTLDKLLQKAIIHEFDPGDGISHFEPTLTPHINLICTKCGEIQDYYDSDIDSFVQKIQSRISHSNETQHLEFYHLCNNCSND